MIDLYLNQTATWRQRVGDNQYGEPITQDTTIKVRWMDNVQQIMQKRLRMHHRQELDSNAVVWCMEDVKAGDVLSYNGRDWTVDHVETPVGLLGDVAYRVVYL